MGKKQASGLEVERRVEEVKSLLLMGVMRHEIVADKTKQWKVKPETIDYYIKKARDKWHEEWTDETAEDLKSKHNLLYKKALIDDDKKEARANLEALARLSGFNKDKVTHDGEIKFPSQIIINQIDDTDKK